MIVLITANVVFLLSSIPFVAWIPIIPPVAMMIIIVLPRTMARLVFASVIRSFPVVIPRITFPSQCCFSEHHGSEKGSIYSQFHVFVVEWVRWLEQRIVLFYESWHTYVFWLHSRRSGTSFASTTRLRSRWKCLLLLKVLPHCHFVVVPQYTMSRTKNTIPFQEKHW